jgi:hypothetical protein
VEVVLVGVVDDANRVRAGWNRRRYARLVADGSAIVEEERDRLVLVHRGAHRLRNGRDRGVRPRDAELQCRRPENGEGEQDRDPPGGAGHHLLDTGCVGVRFGSGDGVARFVSQLDPVVVPPEPVLPEPDVEPEPDVDPEPEVEPEPEVDPDPDVDPVEVFTDLVTTVPVGVKACQIPDSPCPFTSPALWSPEKR